MDIREPTPSDAASVAAIYNHYVKASVVTFEEQELTASNMADRIDVVRSATLPWYLAVDHGTTVGYAYASRWKDRGAYRYTVEVTVYVANGHSGRGIGTALYGRLLPALVAHNVHTALAGIALPNDRSVALHERFGFRKVAHFQQVGFKLGRWIDVGYWQLMLDPTSFSR